MPPPPVVPPVGVAPPAPLVPPAPLAPPLPETPMQVPLLHDCPEPQAWPQLPQLLVLVLVSTQAPLHTC
jgi:hypothetical protein